MTDHAKARTTLMDSTIKTVATSGFENVTTRQIAFLADLNEAYIYRYFLDRDDLFAKTFAREDQKMLNTVLNSFNVFYDKSKSLQERFEIIFEVFWSYISSQMNNALFYARYYFSTYYMKLSYVDHYETVKPLIEKMKEVLIDKYEPYQLICELLERILCHATRIHNGETNAQESNYNQLIRTAYDSVKNLVKDEYRWEGR